MISKKERVRQDLERENMAFIAGIMGQLGGGYVAKKGARALMKSIKGITPIEGNYISGVDKVPALEVSTTQGMVTKPYFDNEEVKLINKYISEKGLSDIGVKINVGNPSGVAETFGDYYNPIRKTVNLKTADKAVALHELGHANDFGKYPLFKSSIYRVPAILSALSVPTAQIYGRKMTKKTKNTIDDKLVDFVKEHPIATSVGGYGIGTLIPEAKASVSALRHIGRNDGKIGVDKALKVLGPAFGTYLLGAIPVGLTAGLVSMFLKNMEKKREVLEKKADISNEVKAAMIGGIPTAIATGLYFNRESTKHALDRQYDVLELKKENSNIVKRLGHSITQKIIKLQRDNPNLSALSYGALAGIITAILMKKVPIVKTASIKQVACIAVMSDGKLLYGKRRDNKRWTQPGGHMEEGETPVQGAVRELKEETNIDAKPEQLIPLKSEKVITDKKEPILVHAFLLNLNKEKATSVGDDPDAEVFRWRWIRPETILKLKLHVPLEKNVVLKGLFQ